MVSSGVRAEGVRMVHAIYTWTVSSDSESEWSLASALVTFAELEALLDKDFPDNLPKDSVPDLELALDAFSSCSHLRV